MVAAGYPIRCLALGVSLRIRLSGLLPAQGNALLASLWLASCAPGHPFDLVLQGGRVIDPRYSQKIRFNKSFSFNCEMWRRGCPPNWGPTKSRAVHKKSKSASNICCLVRCRVSSSNHIRTRMWGEMMGNEFGCRFRPLDKRTSKVTLVGETLFVVSDYLTQILT
jgi:hypothetical protein